MQRWLLVLTARSAERTARVPLDVLLRVKAELVLKEEREALELNDLGQDGSAGRLVPGAALLLDASDERDLGLIGKPAVGVAGKRDDVDAHALKAGDGGLELVGLAGV